jgi:hypothetical protein
VTIVQGGAGYDTTGSAWPSRSFRINKKEISMQSNSALDRGSSSIAPESTGVEARKQPVRIEDRDFLEAVAHAVLRELEGGNAPTITIGAILKSILPWL